MNTDFFLNKLQYDDPLMYKFFKAKSFKINGNEYNIKISNDLFQMKCDDEIIAICEGLDLANFIKASLIRPTIEIIE